MQVVLRRNALVGNGDPRLASGDARLGSGDARLGTAAQSEGPSLERMDHVNLGSQGLTVARQGLGCMGMSEFYGAARRRGVDRHDPPRARARRRPCSTRPTCTARTRTRSWSAGRSPDRRDEVVLATKFGIVRDPDDRPAAASTAAARTCKQACEASLRRLGVDHIDLYYQHRVDPDTPIEETVGAMAELVQEGKVRFLGLSEAAPGHDPPRPRRRTRSAPCRPSTRSGRASPRTEILPTLRELGIGFVPYSPLGRGFLTGTIRARSTTSPRTTSAACSRACRARTSRRNLAIVERIDAIARRARRDARRRSRSPGSTRRATTSCRSPAPSGAATWRRTSARSTSSSRRGARRASTSPAAAGDRYADMSSVNR